MQCTLKGYLTMGQLAELTGARLGMLRRIVDGQHAEAVARAGLYRLVPRRLLPSIRAEVARRRERRSGASE